MPTHDHPLLHGIATFPFRPRNLRTWIILSLSMLMLALVACCFHALLQILPEEMSGFAMIIYRASWHVFTCLCVLTIILSLYPANCFLAIVEQTAAGSDDIDWSVGSWFEYLPKLFFSIWLVGSCAAVSAVVLLPVALAVPMPRLAWWGLVAALTASLCPLALLSALASNAFWQLIHPGLLLRLLLRPTVLGALYLYFFLIVIPCALLGAWMVAELYWWLAPSVGVVWATGWMVYGRVLGRVAWLVTDGDGKKVRRKKRKKAVLEEEM
jgi:hypothetical protein